MINMVFRVVLFLTMIVSSRGWKMVPPSYTLLKTMDTFEIRRYPSIKVATAEEKDNDFYDEKANTFLSLYKYIGGENDRVEQLGLNLPLIDQIIFGNACHTTKYYARNYIVPAVYQDDPPRPTNEKNKVKLKSFDERIMCVRTFPDWASRRKIVEEMNILKNDLKASNIVFDASEVFVLELSAPWEVVNRTNEVSFTCSYVVQNEDVKEEKETNVVVTQDNPVEEENAKEENERELNENRESDGRMKEILSDTKPIE